MSKRKADVVSSMQIDLNAANERATEAHARALRMTQRVQVAETTLQGEVSRHIATVKAYTGALQASQANVAGLTAKLAQANKLLGFYSKQAGILTFALGKTLDVKFVD